MGARRLSSAAAVHPRSHRPEWPSAQASASAGAPVSAGGPAGSRPADGGQPRLRGRRAEPWVDLEGLRHDGGDGPAVAEGGAQFLLADPPGPDAAGLAVAEA